MPIAAVVAPAVNCQFKVIQYGKDNKENDYGMFYNKNGTIAPNSSGIHMGMND